MPEKPRPEALRGDSDVARTPGRSLLAFCDSEDDRELDALFPGANGVYLLRERHILLRSALSTDGRAKTLAHGLAHHLLHRDAAREGDLPAFATEAEGTAHAVLWYFGVRASEYSFACVARWAESKGVVKAALANVQKAVRTLARRWRMVPLRRRNVPNAG